MWGVCTNAFAYVRVQWCDIRAPVRFVQGNRLCFDNTGCDGPFTRAVTPA